MNTKKAISDLRGRDMNSTNITKVFILFFASLLCCDSAGMADPLGTAFTYQGRLIDNDQPADGLYDLQFKLYDAASAGSQTGSDVSKPDVQVTDGYFTVELDFGDNVLNGEARWLEIGVRPGVLSDPSPYRALAPRQELTPAPYSLQTKGIRVDGNGYVGMGTLSPVCSLDVVGRDNAIVLARVNQKGTRAYSGYRLDRDGSEKWLVGMGNTDEKLIFRRTASVNDMVIDTSGNVGIGTTTPGSKLSVGGPGYAGVGVYGTASSNFGVFGESGDWGVGGKHNTTDNYGFLGSSDYGALGYNFSGGNYGYLGSSEYGVYGIQTNSGNYGYLGNSSYGAFGKHNSSGNYGGLGGNFSGVYGEGSSDYGVYGHSDTGEGVYGYNATSGNSGYLGSASYGVHGYSFTGYGVDGYSYSGYGVYGYSGSSGNYGYLGGSGAGVWGAGSMGVYGEGSFAGIYGSSGGTGVYGYSSTGKGVVGYGGTAGTSYDFDAIGPGVNYGTTSSIRWKRDIEAIDAPLEKIMQLRGVYFNWDAAHGGQHDIGMIAEEVGKVLPEIVVYEENGIDADGMDYSMTTPLLVEAVKALKTQVDELRQENQDLHSRLDALEELVKGAK